MFVSRRRTLWLCHSLSDSPNTSSPDLFTQSTSSSPAPTPAPTYQLGAFWRLPPCQTAQPHAHAFLLRMQATFLRIFTWLLLSLDCDPILSTSCVTLRIQ